MASRTADVRHRQPSGSPGYDQGFPSVLDFTSGSFFDTNGTLSPRGGADAQGSAPIPTPEAQASAFESKFLSRFGISPEELSTPPEAARSPRSAAVGSPSALHSAPGPDGRTAAVRSPRGGYHEFSPLFGSIPVHSAIQHLGLDDLPTQEGKQGLEELDPRFDEVVSPMFEYEASPRGRADSDLDSFSIGSSAVPVARVAEERAREANASPTNARPILEKAKELKTKQGGGARKKKGKDKGKEQVKLSLQEFHSISGAAVDYPDPEFEMDDNATPVLWIGNIGPQVTEKELMDEFGEFGNIINLRILRDRYCAFITFDSTVSAVKAKRGLDGEIFGSQYIVINYRQMGGPAAPTEVAVTNPPSNSLWVGNISDGVSKNDLLEEFGRFGIIESIRLLRNCAFVNFSTVEEASRALEELQGKLMGHMHLKINYGKMRANTLSTSPVQIPAELMFSTSDRGSEMAAAHASGSGHSDVSAASSSYGSQHMQSPELLSDEYPAIGGSYSPHFRGQRSPMLHHQQHGQGRMPQYPPASSFEQRYHSGDRDLQQFPALTSPALQHSSPPSPQQPLSEPQLQQQQYLQRQELEQQRLEQQRLEQHAGPLSPRQTQQLQLQQQMQQLQLQKQAHGRYQHHQPGQGQPRMQARPQYGHFVPSQAGQWAPPPDTCPCGRLPRSFVLYPCTHSFCGECLNGTPVCPYCGAGIRSCEPIGMGDGPLQ